uniref:Flt3-interacting zinc finger protein 1 n=1 Tax=Equus asinus TaxID=9793 RepID=A0A9L0JIU6_EQUAS
MITGCPPVGGGWTRTWVSGTMPSPLALRPPRAGARPSAPSAGRALRGRRPMSSAGPRTARAARKGVCARAPGPAPRGAREPLPSRRATMDEAPLPAPPVPAPAPAPAPPAAAPRVPFHCSECGKSFRYRSDLRRHFARHTALKPHACPRCGKGFKHSFNLANHLRSHTGERPYRCSACPKGFRDSTGLLHHQVVHTGEKPYCCLVCELRFSSRSSLGRHLKRQHRGVLPSPLQPGPGLPALSAPCSVCCNVGPCSVCGGSGAGGGEGPEGAGAGPGSWGLAEAAAAAAASLPPFACGACARRFDHGRELAAHWAAHTDVKPFKCPRCERDFNAPALLERHKLTHDLQGPGAPPTQAWASGGAAAGPETAGEGAQRRQGTPNRPGTAGRSGARGGAACPSWGRCCPRAAGRPLRPRPRPSRRKTPCTSATAGPSSRPRRRWPATWRRTRARPPTAAAATAGRCTRGPGGAGGAPARQPRRGGRRRGGGRGGPGRGARARGARVRLGPRQEDLRLLRVREAVPLAARPGAARAGAHGREAVPVPRVRQVLPPRVLPQAPPAAARHRAALPLPHLRQGLHHAQQPLSASEAAPGHGLTRPPTPLPPGWMRGPRLERWSHRTPTQAPELGDSK